MQITLDRALFDPQSDSEAIQLLDLLTTAVRHDAAHAVITDPIYRPGEDNGALDSWLKNRGAPENSAFNALLASGIVRAAGPRNQAFADPRTPRRFNLPGPLRIHVERRDKSDWRSRKVTITDAAELLREPVHLVLENSRTERNFVPHLAGPTNGETLRSLLDQPGRIEPHGGGSGEVLKWLEDLERKGETPAVWRRMLRGWVLFDQDAGDNDAREPSEGAIRIIETCERVVAKYGVGLSWICLCRREIESYIPDNGLHEAKAKCHTPFVEKVIEWRALVDRKQWAWALDLKKGLHGDCHAQWNFGLSADDVMAVKTGKLPLKAHMLKTPFTALSEAEIAALGGGLGDRIGRALRADVAPCWVSDLGAEYDRGPAAQVPRSVLVQSLFDRM